MRKNKKKEKGSAIKFRELVDLHTYLNPDKLASELPFILFMAFLAMLYIGNIHYTERTIKEINRAEREYKELKWEYMSTKSELMYKSKQTHVSEMVEPLGLLELTEPPQKIAITRNGN
jgi:hypothetical protein